MTAQYVDKFKNSNISSPQILILPRKPVFSGGVGFCLNYVRAREHYGRRRRTMAGEGGLWLEKKDYIRRRRTMAG